MNNIGLVFNNSSILHPNNSSTDANSTRIHYDILHNPEVNNNLVRSPQIEFLYYVAYGWIQPFILLMGIIGNTLNLCVLLNSKRKHSTHILMRGMAYADSIIVYTLIPIIYYRHINYFNRLKMSNDYHNLTLLQSSYDTLSAFENIFQHSNISPYPALYFYNTSNYTQVDDNTLPIIITLYPQNVISMNSNDAANKWYQSILYLFEKDSNTVYSGANATHSIFYPFDNPLSDDSFISKLGRILRSKRFSTMSSFHQEEVKSIEQLRPYFKNYTFDNFTVNTRQLYKIMKWNNDNSLNIWWEWWWYLRNKNKNFNPQMNTNKESLKNLYNSNNSYFNDMFSTRCRESEISPLILYCKNLQILGEYNRNKKNMNKIINRHTHNLNTKFWAYYRLYGMYFTVNTFFAASTFVTVSMALERLITVYMPLKCDTICNRKHTRLMVFASFISAIIITLPLGRDYKIVSEKELFVKKVYTANHSINLDPPSITKCDHNLSYFLKERLHGIDIWDKAINNKFDIKLTPMNNLIQSKGAHKMFRSTLDLNYNFTFQIYCVYNRNVKNRTIIPITVKGNRKKSNVDAKTLYNISLSVQDTIISITVASVVNSYYREHNTELDQLFSYRVVYKWLWVISSRIIPIIFILTANILIVIRLHKASKSRKSLVNNFYDIDYPSDNACQLLENPKNNFISGLNRMNKYLPINLIKHKYEFNKGNKANKRFETNIDNRKTSFCRKPGMGLDERAFRDSRVRFDSLKNFYENKSKLESGSSVLTHQNLIPYEKESPNDYKSHRTLSDVTGPKSKKQYNKQISRHKYVKERPKYLNRPTLHQSLYKNNPSRDLVNSLRSKYEEKVRLSNNFDKSNENLDNSKIDQNSDVDIGRFSISSLLSNFPSFSLSITPNKGDRSAKNLQNQKGGGTSCKPNDRRTVHSMGSILNHKLARKERNLTKLLIGISILFTVSVTPQVFVMTQGYVGDKQNSYFYHLFTTTANLLEIVNYCLNFYLYCLCSEDFRRHLRHFFRSCSSGCHKGIVKVSRIITMKTDSTSI
ncbi:unnamed protein product [Gordionus sp. m RMFG-2023]|uniref:uncharacterized protein LOC135930516 n=1 Tax=Gordionus sp. m RMFG-2023 TaxID=3053472 RepID=UPI0030E3FB24